MANQNGRPIAPARKLVAAVVGTIAAFVMVFGLGMSSWAIVALGVAMLALAIGIGMLNVVRRGARAWVSGTAQVKAVSEPPATAIYGRAELVILIMAPGLPAAEVTIRDPRVPIAKWPHPGDMLPVTVDVDDMRRVKIDWDQAEPHNAATATAPPAFYEEDLPDDDLLGGEPEPPPWTTRDRQWGRGPEEPPPPPPPAPRTGDQDDLLPPPPPGVIVRDAPGGPILEGQLVDGDYTQPLPRRAGTATATAPPPPAAPPAAPEEPAAPAEPSAAPTAPAEPSATPAAPAEPSAAPSATAEPSAAPPAPPEAPSAAPAKPSASPAPPEAPPPSAAFAATPAASEATATAAASDAAEPSAAPAAAPAAPTRPADSRPRPRPKPRSVTVEEPAPTSQPSAESPDDDIDLPLDGDPEPPPETRPQARAAMATGIMAPPATDPPAQPLSTEPRAARILDTESRSKPMDDALLGDLEPPPWQQRAPETPSDPDAGESSAVQESPAPPRPRSGRTASPAASAPLSEQAASDPKAATGLAAAVAAGVTALSQAFRAKSSPKTPQRSPAASTPPIPEQRIEQQEAAPERVPRSSVPEQGQRRSPWSDLEDGFQPDDRADELITAYPSARPGSAGAIHGVGITVLVTHLDRSIAFYREMLGFLEIDTGTGSAVLASGDTRLVLRTVHDLSTVAGRHIHLNLEVGDVEAVYQGLKEKGVAFVHGPRPVNRGDKLELWAASFHDPDDHNIAITQWKAIR